MDVARLVGLAMLVETVVDVVKARIPLRGELAAFIWPLLALALGIGLCFAAQAGIGATALVELPWWLDRALAGLIVGGGASTLYDWLDRTTSLGS